MAVYAIGDVQGCYDELLALLERIAFDPAADRLWFVGDLVNRGPQSLQALRFVKGLGHSAQCVLGNHDLHLLAVAAGVRSLHKGDTFGDVLTAPDAAHWLRWLRQQKLAHVEAGWLCVHAGLVPQWDAAETLALAAEVEALLCGPALEAFLPRMYGNEPRQWADTLQGDARLRFVINVLTRLRFCTADGVLDFKTKEGAGAAPPGHHPWFEVPGRASAGQPVAFGHWSTLGLVNRPGLLAIDTGCVWGGALTAVRVDGGRREVLQVPCEQAQTPGV